MSPDRTLVLLLLLTSAGCANNQLRYSTVRQASTLTDLQYQQVLDNLAMFSSDPDALPWHVNLKTGAVQVTDSGTAGFLGQTDFTHNFASSPTLSGSRSIVQQWGSVPVTDDTTLKLLRKAYRIAAGFGEVRYIDDDLADDLACSFRDQTATNADISLDTNVFNTAISEFAPGDTAITTLVKDKYKPITGVLISTNDDGFAKRRDKEYPKDYPENIAVTALARNVYRQLKDVQQEFDEIPVGWFGRGGRRDVPHDACYVGKYGNSYCWVCPEGRAGLAEFSLAILNLSSLIRDAQLITSPSGVQFSPGTSRP
jgi:hypothetical protein